jgi:hypothetical protein
VRALRGRPHGQARAAVRQLVQDAGLLRQSQPVS